MATTVHVKNISSQTSEKDVRDFFSFCGRISNLSVSKEGDGQTAAVTFEKPTAAKTALLLDNTQLNHNLVQVSSAATLEELSSDKSGEGTTQTGSHDDLDQEDKPRSRIVAEYLAHGYTISDKAVERAIALDNQHGFSSRFTNALQQFDAKYNASGKAQDLDQKYGATEKAQGAWAGLNSYFEQAMGTPTGQKVRSYYSTTTKQIQDVHQEARRLADMKSGKPSTSQESSTGVTAEQANMEKVSENPTRTKCNCGGETGACPCEPGKCACASCPKNHEAKA